MPTPATQPPIPPTAVHPTPAAEYKLSDHPPGQTSRGSPELTAALSRHAGGVKDATPPATSEPKVIPAQPPTHTAPEPAPESAAKPPEKRPADLAPHTRFISADDQEPTVPASKESAAEPAKVPGEPAPEVIKSASAQVREAYEKLKADFTARAAEGELTKKELAKFQLQDKQYKDRIKALESVEVRAKELEKQVLTYDEQLRVANYLQHPEFHEKYVRPVAEAMQAGHALVKELVTADPDGNQRYGTESDFAEVLAQPNYALMDKKAVELFGERMSVHVVEQAKAVRHLQQAQSAAIKEAGVKSMEWVKTQQDRAAAARTTARAAFDKQAETLAEKYPQLYRPADGDEEATAARARGEELARLIIDGQPEGMPNEEYLSRVAKIYHRAASFPMRELAVARLQAQVDELQSKLAAYEKSSPDAGSRQQPGGVKQDAGGVIIPGQDDLRATMHQSLAERARRSTARH